MMTMVQLKVGFDYVPIAVMDLVLMMVIESVLITVAKSVLIISMEKISVIGNRLGIILIIDLVLIA